MSENIGKNLALRGASMLDQLPRPYAVATMSKAMKWLLIITSAVFFATHVAPVLSGAMWAMTKLFASGTSMILTGLTLLVTLKTLPKLIQVGERLLDGFAEAIVFSCIKANPVLWLQPAVDEAERGEKTFEVQQRNIEGVLGLYREEAEKIKGENKGFRDGARSEVDKEDVTDFERLAILIGQNEETLSGLEENITAMESVLTQLSEIKDVYHREVEMLRREMRTAETNWKLSGMMDIAMSEAERVLYESAYSSARNRAKQAAGIINERRSATFARLKELRNKTAPIITAYKAGNKKVADELRLKLQQEKNLLLSDISQKEMANA